MIEEKYYSSKEWKSLKNALRKMDDYSFDFYDNLLRKLYHGFKDIIEFLEKQRIIRKTRLKYFMGW